MNIVILKERVNEIKKDEHGFNHIKTVLKLKVGDSFKIGFENDSSFLAHINYFDKDVIRFDLKDEKKFKELSPIYAVLAALRPICLKRMIRELASIGVSKILLYKAQLSDKAYFNSKVYEDEYLKELVLSGAEQSGFTGIAKVEKYDSIFKIFEKYKMKTYVCDNKIEAENIEKVSFSYPALLVIGSERGFTDNEREYFKDQNVTFISLGERILRSETAAVYAFSKLVLKEAIDGKN